jgi:stearoyl-CoA desaturase (delta-9 desaturase)
MAAATSGDAGVLPRLQTSVAPPSRRDSGIVAKEPVMTLQLDSPPCSPLPAVEVEVEVEEERPPNGTARLVTALIVSIPFAALVFGAVRFWGRGITLRDVILAVAFYFLAGHGISIGFHRLLAHRAFSACRTLKVALVACGSMAYEGGPIGWVANHRRHHVFSDTAGDPHSPQHHGGGLTGQLKGLWHAHLGWLFTARSTSSRRHAADLLADRDIVVLDRMFPMWCVLSLALPFGLGWLLGGTFGAALSALFWAGLVRVCVLHHATWSINSVCHMFGRRPFTTRDSSGNVGVLAVVSMGESWHNGHHAFPRSARHGLLPGQLDTSALLIRGFERMAWVSDVHWPTDEALRNRRVGNREQRPPRQRAAGQA